MLLRKLRDSEVAIAYLNEAIKDDPHEIFIKALGNVARAQGIGNIAEITGLRRESLYRSLSQNGNPSARTVIRVIHSLGLEISFKFARPMGTTR